MINLHPGIGKATLAPIVIENSEIGEMNNILRSQNVIDTDNPKVKYDGDDFISKYRIYRLNTHPLSYGDFSDSLIREINTPTSTSTSLDETIIPNNKYWYVFRSIDIHGHLSYPSPVYQIEIVDDGASIYPLIDTVEFKTVNTKVASKPLKRFMHIMPNIRHYIYSDEIEEKIEEAGGAASLSAGDADKIKDIGVADPSLWGKKFKIRLTSKTTGRKIDINVEFKNNA